MDDDVKFRERHPLMRYVAIGLIILIIAGFVTAIVIANDSNSNNANSNKSVASSQTKKTPKATAKVPATTNQPATNSSGNSIPQPGQALSNTGPGNVALLFTATALTAGAAHYTYRRLRKI